MCQFELKVMPLSSVLGRLAYVNTYIIYWLYYLYLCYLFVVYKPKF